MLNLFKVSQCLEFPQVTDETLFIREGSPTLKGLFSPEIFGSSGYDIYHKMGSIHLNDSFLHPVLYTTFRKIFRNDITSILKLKPYLIKDGQIEFQLSETEDSLYGLKPLFKNIFNLKYSDSDTSKEFLDILNKFKDDSFISCINVIPLGYRNYKSEVEFDLLNNYYVEIIKTSKKILNTSKNLNDKTYAMIYNHMVNSLDNLFEAIKVKLSKKEGMIRGNVLGRRVDFSARAVIIGDTSLKPDTIGVPVMIAVKIFEPWVIRTLVKENHYSMTDALDLIQKISKGYNNHEEYELVKDILIRVTRNRLVLAKRDPTLHRLSWQAFRVEIVDDKSIHIYPLQTSGFNADFDGDSVRAKVSLIVDNDNVIYDIMDLKDKENYFEYSHTFRNIDYYTPKKPIYISSINLKTGKVSNEKIITLSIHKDLNMYKIYDTKDRFEPFWVSDDHSLVVYDKYDIDSIYKYIKITPRNIMQDKSRYELLQLVEDRIIPISCEEINIEFDPTVTEAADFTVENTYTFSTFDGIFLQDTMSLFTPMSQEALQEVKKFMNPFNPSNPRRIKYEFSKEYLYAICLLLSNKFGPYSKDVDIKINKKSFKTNLGRSLLFESLNESDRNEETFKIIETEHDINEILTKLVEIIPIENVKDFIDKVQVLCDKVMLENSSTITIDDLSISDKIKPLIDKYTKETSLTHKTELLDEIKKEIIKLSKDSENLRFIVECKSGRIDQILQLFGVKGLVQSPTGEVISIDGNFANGLSKKDYFLAGQGARTGIVSRTNKTRDTGYLARKLVYATSSVYLNPKVEDCGTDRYLLIKNSPEIRHRLLNRYILSDGELVLVTKNNIDTFKDEILKVRSPIYCKTDHICKTCYGLDYKFYDSKNIGMIAAHAISEKLYQNIMKAFHLGGTTTVNIPNILTNLSKNIAVPMAELESIFDYKNHTLYAKEDLTIVLDRELYNFNALTESSEIILDTLIGDIFIKDKHLNLAINSSVLLYINNIEKSGNGFSISYQKGDMICVAKEENSDVELKVKKMIAAIQGSVKFKDINHAFNTLYENLKPFGEISLVHIEVLLSQLARCQENPSLPYRLCPSNEYKIVSIKEIPFLESWLRGLSFENFNKGINNALLHPERTRLISKIDDLLTSPSSEEFFTS